MNQNIVGYYQKVREDEVLQAAFAGCESFDQIVETAINEGRKLGFFFTKEDAMAIGFDVEALHSAATNDDELSDFELELVSAGLPINCSSGVDTKV